MIISLNFYSVKLRQNRPDKGTVMSIRCFRQMILLCILTILPLHKVLAESFWDALLRVTGITATSQVKGEKFLDALLRFSGISVTAGKVKGAFAEGNLWLIKIDDSGPNEAKQITDDGIYHSPLWIPGSDKMVAVKEGKLIQLNIEGSEEKVLHSFSESDYTILLGFDKSDANLMLIIQNGVPVIFSLASGQVTRLPYDNDKKEHRNALDSLMSSFRDYGNTKVYIEQRSSVDASGSFMPDNKIHIKVGAQDTVISCPAECAQPALIEGGRRLVFVGQ